MRSQVSTAILVGTLVASLLPATARASDHKRYYKTGLDAASTEDWPQVEKMMRRAIEIESQEKRRSVFSRRGYHPHYYLGLARYHLGDCRGALASWAESESQGAIIGKDEYAELSELQDDCQQNGRPTRGRSSASAAQAADSTSPTKKTVRTGQHVVERGADPTRKALGALGEAAGEDSDLGRAALKGEKAVGVAEKATNVVDALMPPAARLEAAITAYFAGSPQRTLELLEGIDVSDPRGRAQVYLFRAAANYRLHLLAGQDKARLGAARENADLFQQEQWRKDFPTELFDPRFVRFLQGG